MQYYNSRGEIENFSLSASFCHGTCANIYSLQGQICFKRYYNFTSSNARLDYEMFLLLKRLNHPFIHSILDVYYEEDRVVDTSLFDPNHLLVDAYTFIFLENQNINIMEEPTEYFLYNFIAHEELMEMFSTYKVMMDDVKADNVIFAGDKIMFIDLDNYKISKKSEELIYKNNQLRLLRLYSELFKRCDVSGIYKNQITNLFYDSNNHSKVSDTISKKIMKYKKTIDYFRK